MRRFAWAFTWLCKEQLYDLRKIYIDHRSRMTIFHVPRIEDRGRACENCIMSPSCFCFCLNIAHFSAKYCMECASVRGDNP